MTSTEIRQEVEKESKDGGLLLIRPKMAATLGTVLVLLSGGGSFVSSEISSGALHEQTKRNTEEVNRLRTDRDTMIRVEEKLKGVDKRLDKFEITLDEFIAEVRMKLAE